MLQKNADSAACAGAYCALGERNNRAFALPEIARNQRCIKYTPLIQYVIS